MPCSTRTFLALPLLLTLLFAGCMGDEDMNLPYTGYTAADRGDGLQTGTPEEEGMNPALVDRAYRLLYEDSRYVMARSLLVFRNGRLVAEAYPHDPSDAIMMQNIQSATKSFTSICASIALDMGLFSSMDEKLADILPEEFAPFPSMADISLSDALTMRTGIDFENDAHTLDLYRGEGSSVRFVLEQGKKYDAGTVFHYHDGAPQLVSAAIQKRAGMTLEQFAAEHLFAPLGIRTWKWEHASDGRTFGAFSLFLTPRDCGRFGEMLLDNGTWNGTVVLDSALLENATRAHTTGGSPGAQYGYYFWIYPSTQAFAAEGHGGQYIYVSREDRMVIVYTAWPYTSSELWDNFFEIADLLHASCR